MSNYNPLADAYAQLDAELKLDKWDNPNDKYGVVLFEWYDLGKQYVPKSWRGIQTGGVE